jgi:hypothetical protein
MRYMLICRPNTLLFCAVYINHVTEYTGRADCREFILSIYG